MTERSTLRVRERAHYKEGREDDTIIEVLRAGEVVATIYGSREGVHIVSERVDDPRNSPFIIRQGGIVPTPSLVAPLLSPGEECPWCNGTLWVAAFGSPCPICKPSEDQLQEVAVGITPDIGPRDTAFHKKIVNAVPVPNTKTGHWVTLECGHVVQTFGNLEHAQGVAFCQRCKDNA